MAILVPRWLDSSWQVRLQMCLKFVWQKSQFVWGAQADSTITEISYCTLGRPIQSAIFTIKISKKLDTSAAGLAS